MHTESLPGQQPEATNEGHGRAHCPQAADHHGAGGRGMGGGGPRMQCARPRCCGPPARSAAAPVPASPRAAHNATIQQRPHRLHQCQRCVHTRQHSQHVLEQQHGYRTISLNGSTVKALHP
eukprot:2284558-Rhodomonas_salina.1